MPETYKYREKPPRTINKKLGLIAGAVLLISGLVAKWCASCLSENPRTGTVQDITESCNPGRQKDSFPKSRLISTFDAKSQAGTEIGSFDDPRTPLQKACQRLAYSADGGSEEIYAALEEVGTALPGDATNPKAKMKAIKEIIEACGISEEYLLKVLAVAINNGNIEITRWVKTYIRERCIETRDQELKAARKEIRQRMDCESVPFESPAQECWNEARMEAGALCGDPENVGACFEKTFNSLGQRRGCDRLDSTFSPQRRCVSREIDEDDKQTTLIVERYSECPQELSGAVGIDNEKAEQAEAVFLTNQLIALKTNILGESSFSQARQDLYTYSKILGTIVEETNPNPILEQLGISSTEEFKKLYVLDVQQYLTEKLGHKGSDSLEIAWAVRSGRWRKSSTETEEIP